MRPNQMPEQPQLAPLNMEEERLYSELILDVQAPLPLSTLQRKIILAACVHDLVHWVITQS